MHRSSGQGVKYETQAKEEIGQINRRGYLTQTVLRHFVDKDRNDNYNKNIKDDF